MYQYNTPSGPHLQGSHFLNETRAKHTERSVAAAMETFECRLSLSVTRSAFCKATTLLTIEPIMSVLPVTAFGEAFLHVLELQYLELDLSILRWGQSWGLVCGIILQSLS